jgi:hypothetical protein
MKAFAGLLAVLLMLSSTSLAQTAPVPPTAPAQQAASQPSPSPTASTPSTEAAAATADGVPAVPVVSSAPPFAAGAKLFLEPMDGFEQLLSHAILKKKVPVVLVHQREEADFILSGVARVKRAGWIKGWVESAQGKGYVSITDARSGDVVFTHKFKRADTNLTVGEIYKGWADGCAKDMKKALVKK